MWTLRSCYWSCSGAGDLLGFHSAVNPEKQNSTDSFTLLFCLSLGLILTGKMKVRFQLKGSETAKHQALTSSEVGRFNYQGSDGDHPPGAAFKPTGDITRLLTSLISSTKILRLVSSLLVSSPDSFSCFNLIESYVSSYNTPGPSSNVIISLKNKLWTCVFLI